MDLFEKLGRKAEKFRQDVEDATDHAYQCQDCGAEFAANYDDCPECGGEVDAVAAGE